MNSKIKKLIASKKIGDKELLKFLESYKPESDEEEDDGEDDEEESETQGDSEDLDDAEMASANKEKPKKGTKSLDDLDALIEAKIEARIKSLSKASKKKKTQPVKKSKINQMNGGIEYGSFGLIPTIEKK